MNMTINYCILPPHRVWMDISWNLDDNFKTYTFTFRLSAFDDEYERTFTATLGDVEVEKADDFICRLNMLVKDEHLEEAMELIEVAVLDENESTYTEMEEWMASVIHQYENEDVSEWKREQETHEYNLNLDRI